ncbi:MAG: molybdopterin biosynthesis protein MoeB [Cytophagaceae bacterium]|jgi:adenylyltransferase/sulfurtransferase|nr:molybdopterin biosynthesis protein MoeB [Cytophagaceae bacterium]
MTHSLSKEELSRYSRHISLQEVGLAGQEKIKAASVLVIGAGGLGCPALQYLAAAGVGRIGIIDFDKVDVSNLQRQILYGTDDVGKYKAEAAKARLSFNNPLISFITYTEQLNKDNVLSILPSYDIIVDGSDNFSTRYLVNDACVILNKPLVFGSIFKFDGQVSVFNYSDEKGTKGPTYRCLYPEPPADGEMPSCSEIGVLGVLPGLIGTLQANEALKLILGLGNPLAGKLFTLDALTMQTQLFSIKANPENYTIKELGNYDFSCETTVLQDVIQVTELKSLLDQQADLLLLDVREQYEYDLCRLEGALLIPMNTVPHHLQDLPKNKNIVVYCHHGMRSASIVNFLKANGFEKISNLEGGIHAWSMEVDNTVAVY